MFFSVVYYLNYLVLISVFVHFIFWKANWIILLKYQLEAHSPTNLALILPEEKRLERNNRETDRDSQWVGGEWECFLTCGGGRATPPTVAPVRPRSPGTGPGWFQLRWRGKLESNSRQNAFYYICASHADSQESNSHWAKYDMTFSLSYNAPCSQSSLWGIV